MKIKKHLSIARAAAALLFLTLAAMAFSGTTWMASKLLQLQFGPAILRCTASFSAGALATVIGIAIITCLFGRFYCSVFCPLGILQDVIAFISRRKAKAQPNYAKTKYAIAAAVFGLMVCGWNIGFLLLDPYSNFGRIFGGFTLGAMLPLIIIAALSVWRKRFYCTTICPVGTLLGLFAKFGVFRLKIADKCIKCGKCMTVCPSGCINIKEGFLDNERCVRCMSCISVCPRECIAFAGLEKANVPLNASRRAFLMNSGAMLAGFASGVMLAKAGLSKLAVISKRFKILPPGAGNAERFASKCTACQLCTANCPAKIITSAPGGNGPVSLDLSNGACKYECNRCSQICPTGAIAFLPLAVKQKTKIAEASLNPENCIVFQEGEECGECAKACPTHAIALRKNGAPRPVNPSLCIGCGACRIVCPGSAMTMHEIEKQILLISGHD